VKIVDGNLLIYAANLAAPQHPRCRAWLQEAFSGSEEIGFNWIAITGFLRITTHLRLLAQPLQIQHAVEQVDKWLATPIVRLIEPRANHWSVLKELLLAAGRGGNLTTDAHLARSPSRTTQRWSHAMRISPCLGV